MTKTEYAALYAAMQRHPVYWTNDDLTDRGLIAGATNILNRIADDNEEFRRGVAELNAAHLLTRDAD
jgi:hypothetical protein